jgi:hypothetical protein
MNFREKIQQKGILIIACLMVVIIILSLACAYSVIHGYAIQKEMDITQNKFELLSPEVANMEVNQFLSEQKNIRFHI